MKWTRCLRRSHSGWAEEPKRCEEEIDPSACLQQRVQACLHLGGRVPQVSVVLRDLGVATSGASVVRVAFFLSSFWLMHVVDLAPSPGLATPARPGAPNFHWKPVFAGNPIYAHSDGHSSHTFLFRVTSLGLCLRVCIASMARGICISLLSVAIDGGRISITLLIVTGCSRFLSERGGDIVLWCWDM